MSLVETSMYSCGCETLLRLVTRVSLCIDRQKEFSYIFFSLRLFFIPRTGHAVRCIAGSKLVQQLAVHSLSLPLEETEIRLPAQEQDVELGPLAGCC